MTPAPSTRLPAAERRQAIVDTATQIFSAGSYRGVTTADIARESGVSEPILYRHFASKRQLYLACIEQAWRELRDTWDEAIAVADDAREWLPAMAKASLLSRRRKSFLANFWIQAITEAGGDPEIRRYLRRHVREVHDYVMEGMRRAQEAGAIPADRDASAEAWIFLAGGLLATFAQRLGGVLGDEDFAAISASRRRWLIQDPWVEAPPPSAT